MKAGSKMARGAAGGWGGALVAALALLLPGGPSPAAAEGAGASDRPAGAGGWPYGSPARAPSASAAPAATSAVSPAASPAAASPAPSSAAVPSPDALAAGALGPGFRRRFTEHYRVYADGDTDLAREVGQAAEMVYRAFHREFGGDLTLDPQGRLVALVFAEQREFLAYLERLTGRRQDANCGGRYHSGIGALIVFDLARSGIGGPPGAGGSRWAQLLRESNRRLVFHEGAHQLQYLTGLLPVSAPLWFTEGLASEFQIAPVENGELVLGRPATRYVSPLPGLCAGHLPWTLEFFLGLGTDGGFRGPEFAGGREGAAYGLSWLLFRHLRYEREGGREQLRAFLRSIRQIPTPAPSPGVLALLNSPDPAAVLRGQQAWNLEIGRALAAPRLAAFRQAFGDDLAALERELLAALRRPAAPRAPPARGAGR